MAIQFGVVVESMEVGWISHRVGRWRRNHDESREKMISRAGEGSTLLSLLPFVLIRYLLLMSNRIKMDVGLQIANCSNEIDC